MACTADVAVCMACGVDIAVCMACTADITVWHLFGIIYVCYIGAR